MYPERNIDYTDLEEIEDLVAGDMAYISRISADKVLEISDIDEELITESEYWALFSEDGVPLMLANARQELEYSAFFHDVTTVLPN